MMYISVSVPSYSTLWSWNVVYESLSMGCVISTWRWKPSCNCSNTLEVLITQFVSYPWLFFEVSISKLNVCHFLHKDLFIADMKIYPLQIISLACYQLSNKCLFLLLRVTMPLSEDFFVVFIVYYISCISLKYAPFLASWVQLFHVDCFCLRLVWHTLCNFYARSCMLPTIVVSIWYNTILHVDFGIFAV